MTMSDSLVVGLSPMSVVEDKMKPIFLILAEARSHGENLRGKTRGADRTSSSCSETPDDLCTTREAEH